MLLLDACVSECAWVMDVLRRLRFVAEFRQPEITVETNIITRRRQEQLSGVSVVTEPIAGKSLSAVVWAIAELVLARFQSLFLARIGRE